MAFVFCFFGNAAVGPRVHHRLSIKAECSFSPFSFTGNPGNRRGQSTTYISKSTEGRPKLHSLVPEANFIYSDVEIYATTQN